jgi:hypothetical protein
VCCSSAAANSKWVNKEIDDFIRMNPTSPIVPLLLSGTPEEALPDLLKSRETRYHDLRSAWRFGVLLPTARDELLRALAILTGRDLRELIDWNRRKTVVRGSSALLGLAAIAGASTFYINNQKLTKTTDLRATVRYRLFDDPGLGGGEKLSNWYSDNCTLHIGAYLDRMVPTSKDAWPWKSGQFPRRENAIHLQSSNQTSTMDRRISTAGTWIESVRVFSAFSGELGNLQQLKDWKSAGFEGRLLAVEPKQEGALKSEDLPAKDLLIRFINHYRIDKKQLDELSDVDSFLYPMPIVAELKLEMNGALVFFSQGVPARIGEGDEDARRIHITHFPFGQSAEKPDFI